MLLLYCCCLQLLVIVNTTRAAAIALQARQGVGHSLCDAPYYRITAAALFVAKYSFCTGFKRLWPCSPCVCYAMRWCVAYDLDFKIPPHVLSDGKSVVLFAQISAIIDFGEDQPPESPSLRFRPKKSDFEV